MRTNAILASAVALGVACGALADDAAPAVRVMSFNIRYGTAADGENHWDKRKDFLAATIRAFDPDLLGTQETLAFQRDYLAAKMSGYGVFAAGRDDGKEAGEMAALYWRLGRYEKLDGGHFWLSETPDAPGSKGWDAALPRVATWVKLRDRTGAGAKPLLFANAHLDHVGRRARAESAKLMCDRVTKLGEGCTLVVTGDFNAEEGSEPYRALFGNGSPLIDAFRVARPARAADEGTFSGFRAVRTGGPRIDWIGCSRDWSVVSAAVDRTAKDGRTPSDHFPVTAILKRP